MSGMPWKLILPTPTVIDAGTDYNSLLDLLNRYMKTRNNLDLLSVFVTAVCLIVGRDISKYTKPFTSSKPTKCNPAIEEGFEKLGFATLMNVAKPLTPNNYKYLFKRWNSYKKASKYFSPVGSFDDNIPISRSVLLDNVSQTTVYIDLEKLVQLLIKTPTNITHKEKAIFDQIRLVYKYAKMITLLVMRYHAFTPTTLVCVIPEVAENCKSFKKLCIEVEQKLGDRFPYCRILRLSEVQVLNQGCFPNLAYLARKFIQQKLGPARSKSFVLSNIRPTSSPSTIRELLKESIYPIKADKSKSSQDFDTSDTKSNGHEIIRLKQMKSVSAWESSQRKASLSKIDYNMLEIVYFKEIRGNIWKSGRIDWKLWDIIYLIQTSHGRFIVPHDHLQKYPEPHPESIDLMDLENPPSMPSISPSHVKSKPNESKINKRVQLVSTKGAESFKNDELSNYHRPRRNRKPPQYLKDFRSR